MPVEVKPIENRKSMKAELKALASERDRLVAELAKVRNENELLTQLYVVAAVERWNGFEGKKQAPPER